MDKQPQVSAQSQSKFTINEEISEVGSGTVSYLVKNYSKKLFWGVMIFVVFEVGMLYFINTPGGVTENNVFVFFLPIVAVAIFLGAVYQKIRHEFYRQFANLNGFSYSQNGWLENRPGALFSIGYNTRMEDVVSGQIAGVPINLFNYSYSVKVGKQSYNYTYTVWEINFQTPVPPMLLLKDWNQFSDALQNNNLKKVSSIGLEKNMEKHFTLYSEKKFEIEALQIFTPELLKLIYEKYKTFSLDFAGTSLFIYANKMITTKAQLQLMKELAEAVTAQLAKKLPSMGGSITALNEALKKS